MSYRRLTPKDRYQIDAYLQSSKSKTEIAKLLGRSKSTITRELRRTKDFYRVEEAQNLAREKSSSRRRMKVKFQPHHLDTIAEKMSRGFSPEQIVGRDKFEGHESYSTQTIYNYIARDIDFKKRVRPFLRVLRKQRKDRKKPGWKTASDGRNNRTFINERPCEVDRRSRLGDIERDTIFGKLNSSLLLTMVDRVSRKTWIKKISRKCSHEIHRATVDALKDEIVLSITNDNGTEFNQHQQTASELNTKIYFAKAYASWQRGTNENTNGLIRQYCPRRADIKYFTDAEIQKIEDRLNNRPRKCLGFKTPNEVHLELSRMVALDLGIQA